MRRLAVDRFAEKIALTEAGCIEWIASLNGAGYGQFFVDIELGNVGAHRSPRGGHSSREPTAEYECVCSACR